MFSSWTRIWTTLFSRIVWGLYSTDWMRRSGMRISAVSWIWSCCARSNTDWTWRVSVSSVSMWVSETQTFSLKSSFSP